MSGTLFVVATPIGNLEDITLRALRVLREADAIAAEDTRRTARLLAHHAISTPTLSFHEHNTRTRMPQLITRLEAGQRIALVTDAGTPGISDPGAELVEACVAAGIAVEPVPGVSAPLTAALASGFPLIPLTILGFPPARGTERRRWFENAAAITHTFTLFEAPHRIASTLGDLRLVMGNRPIVIGRELTKVHQQFLRGSADTLGRELQEPRGEMTLVVGPNNGPVAPAMAPDDRTITGEFGLMAKSARSRRAAVTAVARKLGLPAREVYAAIERTKKSGG